MKPETMELCLSCMVALEESGYEAEIIQEGKITCGNCGKKCWGQTVRLSKDGGEEAERE